MPLAQMLTRTTGQVQSTAEIVTTTNNINPLQQYINSLGYIANTNSQISTARNSNQLGYVITEIANQVSFTSIAPNVLQSIDYIFYADSACTTIAESITTTGTSIIRVGTYTTSDQSLFALCSNYSTGCSGLLNAAQAGNVKAMQFKYNFSNGVSSTMPCMSNSTQGYEVIANYATPNSPVACSSGNQCGFSQSY